MRENRQSGSEGGATGVTTGRPYPYVRLKAHVVSRVQVPASSGSRGCNRNQLRRSNAGWRADGGELLARTRET